MTSAPVSPPAAGVGKARLVLLSEASGIVVSAQQSGAVQFFLILFLQRNSQIIDTAEDNLTVG